MFCVGSRSLSPPQLLASPTSPPPTKTYSSKMEALPSGLEGGVGAEVPSGEGLEN